MLDRDRDRGVQELAAEPLAAVPGRDQRAEEVGVGERPCHLHAAEADDLAVLDVDEQRRLGRLVPVGELALELVQRGPQRVADLFLRPAEGTAGEIEDGRDVLPAEATQAAGHEEGGVRCERSRGPRPR